MGEGLETTPEEEKLVENPEEAEIMAKSENDDRLIAAAMRSLSKLSLRAEEDTEFLDERAEYYDAVADRIGRTIQKANREYHQMLKQLGSGWLEEQKGGIEKIREGKSEKFPELKGKDYYEIIAELLFRNEDMRLISAALEMTDLSPISKLTILELQNKRREQEKE